MKTHVRTMQSMNKNIGMGVKSCTEKENEMDQIKKEQTPEEVEVPIEFMDEDPTILETLSDAIYKVIIIMFASLIAGIGMGMGSVFALKVYEAFKIWSLNQP